MTDTEGICPLCARSPILCTCRWERGPHGTIVAVERRPAPPRTQRHCAPNCPACAKARNASRRVWRGLVRHYRARLEAARRDNAPVAERNHWARLYNRFVRKLKGAA